MNALKKRNIFIVLAIASDHHLFENKAVLGGTKTLSLPIKTMNYVPKKLLLLERWIF